MSDPKPYIDEAAKDARTRGSYMLSSPSFFRDDEFKRAQEIARTKGPLTDAEMIRFQMEHDRFATLHFLDFVFELERLYSIINWLVDPKK